MSLRLEIARPALVAAVLALAAPATAAAQESLSVQTVPEIEGARFVLDGRTYTTDAEGRTTVLGDGRPGLARRVSIPETLVARGVRVQFSRRDDQAYLFNRFYRVRLAFVDLEGRRIDPSRVSQVTLKGSHGVRVRFTPGGARWLQGARVVPFDEGYRERRVTWVVEKVIVDGENVVHRNQQRFEPSSTPTFRINLLFYPVHFAVTDGLFGFATGSGVSIRHPNGRVERYRLGPDGQVDVPSLPRGEYRITVEGSGLSFEHPLALSREQEVDLQLLSYLDVAVVLGGLAAIALGLLYLGGRRLPWPSHLIRRRPAQPPLASTPPVSRAEPWRSELHLDFGGPPTGAPQTQNGTCIEWDRGLGKALGACSIVDVLGARRTLVVCPGSVRDTAWAANLRRFLPGHDIQVLPDARSRGNLISTQLSGSSRFTRPTVLVVAREALPGGAGMSQAGLAERDDWLGLGEWELVVVDDPSGMSPRQRLVLSGAMVQGRANELATVARWLLPEVYRGNWRDWARRLREGDGRELDLGIVPWAPKIVRPAPRVFLVYRRGGALTRGGGWN